jgi:large subunit ribosomal protein L15
MKYNELVLQRQRTPIRKGRGISAGRGKTAGRGTKGQGARKSGGVRPGFEGGQTPLHIRLPKMRGFRSLRTPAETVYTSQLESISGAIVDAEKLHKAGLISSQYVNVKLLVKGDLTTKKEVKLPAASAKAIEALEKAGGSFTITARLARPKVKKSADK